MRRNSVSTASLNMWVASLLEICTTWREKWGSNLRAAPWEGLARVWSISLSLLADLYQLKSLGHTPVQYPHDSVVIHLSKRRAEEKLWDRQGSAQQGTRVERETKSEERKKSLTFECMIPKERQKKYQRGSDEASFDQSQKVPVSS